MDGKAGMSRNVRVVKGGVNFIKKIGRIYLLQIFRESICDWFMGRYIHTSVSTEVSNPLFAGLKT
jgi:hypothetical protein